MRERIRNSKNLRKFLNDNITLTNNPNDEEDKKDNIEEDISQTNKGSFVTENDKWRFEMLGVTRIFDGQKLYSISPDDEEITISSQDPEDEATITPNKMLYFYENGYNFIMDDIRYVGNSQFRKKIQYVKLIPKDSEAEIKHILLGIDTEFNHIYEVIETGKSETITTISIIDFEFNLKLDENLFVFEEKKYIDYYINIID